MGKILTTRQIARHHDDGCVFPIRVLSTVAAAEALRQFEACERRSWGATDHAYDDADGREWLRRPHRRFRWAFDIATHPRVIDAIEDLLGPDIMLWDAKLFPKPPRSDSFVSWHQDGTYVGLRPIERVVTAWVALSESGPENGAMRYVPGSHKLDQLPHARTFAEGNLLSRGQIVDYDTEGGPVVDVCLAPGEMSVHHMMLIHGSPPNLSERKRVGLSINYTTPEVVDAGDDTRPAMVVRGTDAFGHFESFEIPAA